MVTTDSSSAPWASPTGDLQVQRTEDAFDRLIPELSRPWRANAECNPTATSPPPGNHTVVPVSAVVGVDRSSRLRP